AEPRHRSSHRADVASALRCDGRQAPADSGCTGHALPGGKAETAGGSPGIGASSGRASGTIPRNFFNVAMAEHPTVSNLCRVQAEWCERLGSPLYSYLLRRAAEDYEQGGPVRELLEPHANDPRGSALALRMMGAVHRLAHEGKLPEL